MLTREQHHIMAEFIAEVLGDEAEDYVGEADAVRDDFEEYDGRHWAEWSGKDDADVAGYPAVYYERVQAHKGRPRVALWVVDFGECLGVYQS
jgi:hypothetical protein